MDNQRFYLTTTIAGSRESRKGLHATSLSPLLVPGGVICGHGDVSGSVNTIEEGFADASSVLHMTNSILPFEIYLDVRLSLVMRMV